MEKDLSRFVAAHQRSFEIALNEIQNGKKMTHWMWWIFPQMHGLGKSLTSQYYAIQDLAEARAFLSHPYLGRNLIMITRALLELVTDNPTLVFGRPDDWKLKSCMTLFASISEYDSVFHQVLEKYFCGKQDKRTLSIINHHTN